MSRMWVFTGLITVLLSPLGRLLVVRLGHETIQSDRLWDSTFLVSVPARVYSTLGPTPVFFFFFFGVCFPTCLRNALGKNKNYKRTASVFNLKVKCV